MPDRSSPVTFTAVCVRQLGITTPAFPVDPRDVETWTREPLADPEFDRPRSVELLLGAELIPEIMRAGNLQRGGMYAQNTAFGWAISGRSNKASPVVEAQCLSLVADAPEPPWHQQLVESVQRFWEMEDVPTAQRTSALHAECEKSFAEHRRDADGKYIVRLPLRSDAANNLGSSEASARASLSSLHRRMRKDPQFAAAYRQFMSEYLELGHMRVLSAEELQRADRTVNYIPHHGIWQRGDKEARLRVVFNASRPTSSGQSLNDILHSGPKLQSEIWAVLIRWRSHRIAFCTDIRMMFRQIWVDERDVDFQRILWSSSEEEPIQHMQLLTVTYGTSCAPYLSLRVIQQLCRDEGRTFPEAANAALRDRYVDDILSGAHELDDARALRDQLIGLMKAGGFPLRKWVSNRPELLESLDASECLRPTWIKLSDGDPVRELGINWDPREDRVGLACPPSLPIQRSKRQILSVLASIFDPCGWLAPATLLIKLLLQDLWRAGLDWDEELPSSMSRRWITICEGFPAFSGVSLPRWISTTPAPNRTCLHAFADASRRAMAAVIYSRTTVTTSTTSVDLLIAKTKLAPIRSLRPALKPVPRMTIPRLELRAALIAIRLLRRTCDELQIPLERCFAWSDSEIVLHWIRSMEPTGNSIVDSYVHQIQELSPTNIWRHVPSEMNPADVASRGADVAQLQDQASWLCGPEWLKAPPPQWPPDSHEDPAPDAFEGTRQTVALTSATDPSPDHLSKFSSLGRLLRFLVRLRRWVRLRLNRTPTREVLSPITSSESQVAFEACVRLTQKMTFSEEIALLEQMQKGRESKPLPGRGPLATLSPFVCPSGILRVGGRLENSKLPYDSKHPPILYGATHLAGLVVAWAHERCLHGGFRSTYSYTLQRAWLVGGARRIRSFINHCVPCARHRARPSVQLMAALPRERVTPTRAFARTGVDYAGPFLVLPTKGRGVRTIKVYVAVFVCMTSKAVHLEAAGDLSTESFMGALTRFCGRRGRPAEIWSDNATTFHRADVELKEALQQESLNWDRISNHLAEDGVDWHFIPPSAPHFGGLWEAAVKSFKAHLKKTIGPRHLTYEEFVTLLVSIEVVLNCRPLGPISGDLDDLKACTPGHLLVGDSLLTVPDVPTDVERLDTLQHWKLVQGLRAKFWLQWGREYLNTLQQRGKWLTRRDNIKVDDLVMVLDPSLLRPDGRWPLGRIVMVHPGRDGLVRSATVKTEHGEYVRPIVKLAVLPVSEEPIAESSAIPPSASSSLPSEPTPELVNPPPTAGGVSNDLKEVVQETRRAVLKEGCDAQILPRLRPRRAQPASGAAAQRVQRR